MIENRVRIEKQILLGRQVVHRAYKSKSRSTSHEPRHILQQKSVRDPGNSLQAPSASLSPPPSGSDPLLSVDTDAEAAFARGSRFYKRGHASENHSSSGERNNDQYTSTARRRRWTPEQTNGNGEGGNSTELVTEAPSPRAQSNSGPLTSNFLSKFRSNSTSKLSLPTPFSLEHGFASLRESSAENQGEYNWSSESSTDEYPLNE